LESSTGVDLPTFDAFADSGCGHRDGCAIGTQYVPPLLPKLAFMMAALPRLRKLATYAATIDHAREQGRNAMRITTIFLREAADWPAVELNSITRGLNAIVGWERSANLAVADFLAHALFGAPPAAMYATGRGGPPAAEVIVESGQRRFRVRRFHDANGVLRLTVAALDGSAADTGTIQSLVRGLSPSVLSPLCGVRFREAPDVGRLLSAEFARGWHFIDDGNAARSGRRTAELAARRDMLAQELETRIAAERRESKTLETRWRELDRLVHGTQQQASNLEQRLKAVESALAETDARLRYRRLELDVELRWETAEPIGPEQTLAELDEQVARWRGVLAELAEREASARARLAQIQSSRMVVRGTLADQQSWLAVAHQLAADLSGEVARLARANASQQCVCRDAHPRLRPIAETIARQLQVLENLIGGQQASLDGSELQVEVDHLARSQAELRRHVDHLLDRRESTARRPGALRHDASGNKKQFSAADAEQLETRRLELEEQRFQLVEQLRTRQRVLSELRDERCEVERQRAALLSARSIEHVQRELAAVQQKLEQAAVFNGPWGEGTISGHIPPQASDLLAQLTDGGLVRLTLAEHNGRACVVNRAGETVPADSLAASERDQVYLSLCLALLSAAGRQGVCLPLVLDEPFERLDARGTAALAAVLDDFARQGHQVLVFTGQQSAAARLASMGAAMHDLAASQPCAGNPLAGRGSRPSVGRRRKTKRLKTAGQKKKSEPAAQPLNGQSPEADRTDAA
jgi:hypothetical protein